MEQVHTLQPVLLLLFVGIVAVFLVRPLRMSPIVGYLIAGVLVGPYGLSILEESKTTHLLAELGVVFLVHPVNGEVPPVKGRPWKLPHYANRGKTSSSGGELASARSCFSTVRTALGKLRITGLLARFDVARNFPQFPRPLLLQPTIWTSERGADLGSGKRRTTFPPPHLPDDPYFCSLISVYTFP